MEIGIRNENGVVHFDLTGRIDTNTSAELQSALENYFDTDGFQIILDFAGIDFVSSAGLRVLLMTEKKAKAHNGKAIIRNVNSNILEVFEMTSLINILTIE